MANLFDTDSGNLFGDSESSSKAGIGNNTAGSPYITTEMIERVLGKQTVDDYTSDLTQANKDLLLQEAMEEAHDLLLSYTLRRYNEEELRGNRWTMRREVHLACYYLTQRRAQSVPTGVSTQYNLTLEDLEGIANNEHRVIPGASPRHAAGPNISNYEIDDSFIHSRHRRSAKDSTSTHPEARPTRRDLRGNNQDY